MAASPRTPFFQIQWGLLGEVFTQDSGYRLHQNRLTTPPGFAPPSFHTFLSPDAHILDHGVSFMDTIRGLKPGLLPLPKPQLPSGHVALDEEDDGMMGGWLGKSWPVTSTTAEHDLLVDLA
ncbi:MAG: hypothetical protein M1832_001072 [Thelocarpon impressellum]|nr:MAG: hypothetical protein M1832_001072 [Thelocarpon impressellum]